MLWEFKKPKYAGNVLLMCSPVLEQLMGRLYAYCDKSQGLDALITDHPTLTSHSAPGGETLSYRTIYSVELLDC